MSQRQLRKRKFIDKKQQIRFALELVLYATLFPLFFLILSLADPIASSFMGEHTEGIQPLYALFVFCGEHWWQFLVALAMVGSISILFSHRIVGPIYRFESALNQKRENPAEPVNCKLRSNDYFQKFALSLHEFLNSPPALTASGDPEALSQSGPEIQDQESEVST